MSAEVSPARHPVLRRPSDELRSDPGDRVGLGSVIVVLERVRYLA